MATSTLASLGLGSSGVLTYDLIDKLRTADESGIITPIDNKLTTNSSKTSDLSILTSLTSSLETITKSLSEELSYLKRTTTVSNSAVSVTAASGSTVQDFTLHVNNLAQRDIYQSSAFASETSTFSTSTTTSPGTVIAPIAVSTDGVAAIVGVTESSDITFDIADMISGDTITIGGLTLTATGNMTQADVVAAFENISAGTTPADLANGTWSGTLTGFSSGIATGSTVTFTSTTANTDVTDIGTSTTGTLPIPTINTTNGVTPQASSTESSVVTFNAAGMSYGDTMTIGGLTLRATGAITQAEAIAAFANLSAGTTAGNSVTNGSWSGTLTGFNSGAASGSTVSFTSSTADTNVTDLSVSATQEAGGTTTVPATYTIDINVAGKTYTLDMTSSTTLSQFKEMINDKTDGKVNATILNVGGTNPYKLILKSTDVGADNAITFGSTSISALRNLGLDSTTLAIPNGNHLQTALDASFKFNGVNITRTTNTISDLLSGVSITLNEAQTDATTLTNVSITQDLTGIKDNITSMVSKYNELSSNLKTATNYDSDTETAGTFQSSSQIKSLQSELRRQILSTDSDGRSIANYGITFDSDGVLTFDSTIFDTKAAASTSELEDFFRGSTTISSTLYKSSPVSSNALTFISGDFSINGTEILFSTLGVDATTNLLAIQEAINAAGITGIEAILGDNNNIKIISTAGYDIEITGESAQLSLIGLSASTTTSKSTTTDGFFTKFDDLLKSYVYGSESILGLLDTQLATEKTSLTAQRVKNVLYLDNKYSAMATKFAAYDSIINSLNTQLTTITAMIDAASSSSDY